MHDLFALQIGALVYSPRRQQLKRIKQEQAGEGLGEEEELRRGRGEDADERRAITLGIALKLHKSAGGRARGDEEDEDEGVSAAERQLFGAVMEMVNECLDELA